MVIRMVVTGGAGVLTGLAGLPADAQDSKDPKGVMVKGLITSLGGFSATVNAPLLITGSTVVLEPGGQTGRQQFRMPTYIYVVEGILTTFYEAGPVGIQGAQYHGAGQSFMDNGGGGHKPPNRSRQPLKVTILPIGHPRPPAPVPQP